jgi:hypothetical protein
VQAKSAFEVENHVRAFCWFWILGKLDACAGKAPVILTAICSFDPTNSLSPLYLLNILL